MLLRRQYSSFNYLHSTANDIADETRQVMRIILADSRVHFSLMKILRSHLKEKQCSNCIKSSFALYTLMA